MVIHMENRVPSEAAPLIQNGDAVTTPQRNIPPRRPSYGTSGPLHSDRADSGDNEAGRSQDDGDNPLFRGLPEVKERLKYILPSVGVGVFLAAADQTIIVAASGKIGSDLNALSSTSWIATSYFLTLTSIQPLYGKLSDVFGRKSSLLFAYAIFGLGALFCGLARNMPELIAARAFAGIGGGGMTTVVSILLNDIVPLRERGTWQGLTNIIFTMGSASGAPLGGVIADYLSWRWGFLLQVPLCALAFASVSFVLNLPSRDVSGWRTKLRRVDFLGAFVLVAAVLSLIFGLDRGANSAWRNLSAILPLCLSMPFFLLFVFIENKLANEPFAPKRIILERSLLAAYLCNFFANATWLSFLFYLPLYYQVVDHTSASQAGLRLLPGIITAVIGSLSAGLLMQKTGKYYWLTVIGYSDFALAFVVVILCSGTLVNSVWGISIGLSVMALGAGIGITTTLTSVIANASSQDQAIATACSYLFRSLGAVIGLSLSATVVQQSLKTLLRDHLKGSGNVDSIERNVRKSLEFIHTLEPKLQEIVLQCYGMAIRNGFVFMMILLILGVISSFFIREKKLSK